VVDGEADTNQVVVFDGTVVESVFQGETAFALVAIDEGTELSVRFGTSSAAGTGSLHPGEQVSIGLLREDVIIIPRDR